MSDNMDIDSTGSSSPRNMDEYPQELRDFSFRPVITQEPKVSDRIQAAFADAQKNLKSMREFTGKLGDKPRDVDTVEKWYELKLLHKQHLTELSAIHSLALEMEFQRNILKELINSFGVMQATLVQDMAEESSIVSSTLESIKEPVLKLEQGFTKVKDIVGENVNEFHKAATLWKERLRTLIKANMVFVLIAFFGYIFGKYAKH